MSLFRWIVLYFKGGDKMFAKFFAVRVIAGREKYEDVPKTLRPQVDEYLKEEGLEHLITE